MATDSKWLVRILQECFLVWECKWLSFGRCSFHVGSGCWDATAFSAAVASARVVFDIGESEGFHFDLLDIGGGFPGQNTAKITFEEVNCLAVPLRGSGSN